MKEIKLKGEYLTLGQLLKILGLVSTGGETKIYLASHKVFVNDNLEQRRGRKLRINDIIKVDTKVIKIV